MSGPTKAEILAAIDGQRGYMDNWAGRARNEALSEAHGAVEKLFEAHPVEPAPVSAVCGNCEGDTFTCGGCGTQADALTVRPAPVVVVVTDEMRAAGLAALHDDNEWHRSHGAGVWRANYKRAVDLVLEAALQVAPVAVSSTSDESAPRPIDREALAICLHSFDPHSIGVGETWGQASKHRKGAFLYQADAVLALINGGGS